MTDSFDEVLEESAQPKGVPTIVKTLAIISYVGNTLWALLFLIVALALNSFKSMLVNRLDAPAMSTDQLMNYILIASIVIVLICIVSIIGAAKMTKGSKTGFYLYAVANGLWTVILLLGGTPQGIVCGLISLGFIVGFGMQLKNFKA